MRTDKKLPLVLLLMVAAALAVAPGASAHEYGKGMMSGLASAAEGLAAADLETSREVPTTPPGPCTEAAKSAFPIGGGHDHTDMKQHGQACRMRQVAFLPLLKELAGRPDVILGEMDVKADIAAVSITFPRAGILFFDVSDPANPKFLSKYDSTECDQAVIDVNCGAFVDLSADGRTAYLSVQKLSFAPAQVQPQIGYQQGPGIEVVDISDPEQPLITQAYPVAGITGVHTARSHVMPDGTEYVFSNQNGLGIDIARVQLLPGGRRQLVKLPAQSTGIGTCRLVTICNSEVHDTFIQNDPLDGKTYLYNAAGFDAGFQVYDVSNPSQAKLVAEWDLTPECTVDWYSHTIDVTHRGGRRYVTLPVELFLSKDPETESGLAEASKEEQQKGCNKFQGSGDKAGPMWIIDATDFSKLGPADQLTTDDERAATADELKRNSERALVTTWTNPAGRAAGSLTFTPHNQQIVGDRIYLSHYHGGVHVLDASAAFDGRKERPRELSFIVPNGEPVRPLLGQPLGFGVAQRFFTDFPLGRSETWDMFFYKGYVLAADMTGGFYSLRETEPPPPGQQGGGIDNAQAGAAQAAPGCLPASGFRTAGVAARGRRVRFAFTRAIDRPVTVDVLRQGTGRRVGDRLVARFGNRARAFTWNGRSNLRGRRVTDGYYLVRYRMTLPSGRVDVRRVVVRRANGRFAVRRRPFRRESCGLLPTFKLERSVFGGRTNRPLSIAFRLASASRVTVVVRRGNRVVKRFAATDRAPGRIHRLRMSSRGLPRGDYRVTLTAVSKAGRRARATLTSRRI